MECDIYDCLIIGGGPGGLTAASYLGRYLRSCLVFDSGASRARLIPATHNYPGFPHGIRGAELLQKLRERVDTLGIKTQAEEVIAVRRAEDGIFTVATQKGQWRARAVIAASGIIDDKPQIPGIEELIYDGVVRFCPICDGYEALDKRVGVIGRAANITGKARFLRSYTSRIALFPLDDSWREEDRAALRELGITIPQVALEKVILRPDGVSGQWRDGSLTAVDIIYPAMGAQMRTGYLEGLDVTTNEKGCLFTDTYQQTNIKNLYAVGDITLDLSQIAVAAGQAAIAATHIHNMLPLNIRKQAL